MVKVKLDFVRVENEDVKAFKENLKTNNEQATYVLGTAIRDYNRSRGLDLREKKLIQQRDDAMLGLEEVRKLRLEYTEFFSRQMVSEVDKIIAPLGPDGARRMMTEKSMAYWIERLSKKFQSKPASIRILVTQRIYEVFKDDTVELQRLLDIMQVLDEDNDRAKNESVVQQ